MNMDNLANKAKDAANDNRDKITEQSDRVIDSKVDGDKADKAKAGVDKGLDSVLGKGENPKDAPEQK